MKDSEGFRALSFKEQFAEAKDKEDNFGFGGNGEELGSGREGTKVADMEETAIELN